MITDTNFTEDRFSKQVGLLTLFYVISTVIDWLTFGLTQYEQNKKGGAFKCLDEKYLIVETNAGAALLLLFTLVLFAYSLVMCYVFYELPRKEGLAL